MKPTLTNLHIQVLEWNTGRPTLPNKKSRQRIQALSQFALRHEGKNISTTEGINFIDKTILLCTLYKIT